MLAEESVMVATREVAGAVGHLAMVAARLAPDDRDSLEAAFRRVAQMEFLVTDALRANRVEDPQVVLEGLDAAIEGLRLAREAVGRLRSVRIEATSRAEGKTPPAPCG